LSEKGPVETFRFRFECPLLESGQRRLSLRIAQGADEGREIEFLPKKVGRPGKEREGKLKATEELGDLALTDQSYVVLFCLGRAKLVSMERQDGQAAALPDSSMKGTLGWEEVTDGDPLSSTFSKIINDIPHRYMKTERYGKGKSRIRNLAAFADSVSVTVPPADDYDAICRYLRIPQIEVPTSVQTDCAEHGAFSAPVNSSAHQFADGIGIRAPGRDQQRRKVMIWGSLAAGVLAALAILAVLGLRHLNTRHSVADAVRVHNLCARAVDQLDVEVPATYQKARDGLRAALSDQEQLACYNELLVDKQADIARVVFAVAGLWDRTPRSKFPLMLDDLVRSVNAWVSTDSLDEVLSAFSIRHSKREDAVAFWAPRMQGAVAKPGVSSKRSTDKGHQIPFLSDKPPPGAFDESGDFLSVEEMKTKRRLALLDDWISHLPIFGAPRHEWKPPWLIGDANRDWISWQWQEILGTWGWLDSCSKVAVEPLPGRATSRAIRSWMAEYLGYKDAWMLPRRPEPCPLNPEFESCRVKYEPKGREFTCEKTGFGEPICLPVHGEEGVCVSPI